MPKKILVVDNSLVILKLVSHILERSGHTVQTAENGLAALETLKTFTPDIIFVDLIMPKISGDIFCRIVRSRKEFHQIILVILSAVAAEEKLDYTSIGADAYIAKGPAAEMEKHIKYVIENCKVGKYHLSNREILGLENVHRREITSELLTTKHHFEITLEHMTDGFIEMTSDAKIIYANSKAAHFFHLTKEELIASLFYTNFPEKYQARMISYLKNLKEDPLETGENEVLEIAGVRVLLKFIPVQDKEEKSIVVLIRDISRRNQLKKQVDESLLCLEENVALRTKEYLKSNQLLQDEIEKYFLANTELSWVVNQLHTALDLTSDLISLHDENMRLIKVNKAFAESFGKKPEELIGQYCYSLLHKDGLPSPQCPHYKAILENKTISEVTRDLLPGKTIRLTCSPCFDADGHFRGSVCTANAVKDISLLQKK